MSSGGNNPIRWDCEKRGCFNLVKRPKIEMFHECFPRKISFGDVDGIVEIGGRFLMLEWKPARMELSRGQAMMYERITANPKWTVVIVAGDAQTMEIDAVGVFQSRMFKGWEESSLDDLKRRIKSWARRADGKPAPSSTPTERY